MVEFNNKVRAVVSDKWVNSVVNKILKELNRKGNVSIALIEDKEIKKINKKYRKKDEVTDVLSFSNLESEKLAIPEGADYLGEIIIGYEEMKRQSTEHGHSERRELLTLLIHGVLHLLGYEHEQGGEKAEVMRKKEVELLGMFKINNFRQRRTSLWLE